MRIETTQRISSTGTARRRSGAAGGGSFSVSVPEEKSASQGVGASTSLSGIEALMTLQEVDEADVRKRRALKRGHDLLDLLETVRLDMIGGHRQSRGAEAAERPCPASARHCR